MLSVLKQWLRPRSRVDDTRETPLAQAKRLRQQGEFAVAQALCLDVLNVRPDDVDALALLIGLAADERQIEVGLRWVQRALDANPNSVPVYYALGQLWETAEQFAKAEAAYRRTTELDPLHAKAHNNLGCMLHTQGRLDEALLSYQRALQVEPDQPEALRNSALISGQGDDLRVAMSGFEQRIRANPQDAMAHYQLAQIYMNFGRSDEALAGLDQAIRLDPNQAEFHFSRAQTLLKLGRYPEGWRAYQWRWQIGRFNAPMQRFSQPCWSGTELPQGTLLIHGETGFGDMFQFVRYATCAAQRCQTVVVECQPALMQLVAKVSGVSRVVAQGGELPAFDAHIPLISLPAVFATDISSIPWSGPYIAADPDLLQDWAHRLSKQNSGELKVGLVWSSNPKNMGQQERSVPLSLLPPLVQLEGVQFFSLQKDASPAHFTDPLQGMRFVDMTADIADFSDTAALLTQLDLVVSVDTAVAHLAGAMGVPVWVMLPFSADWRHHQDRDDNPWYPSMRLFRQTSAGDWGPVLQRLAREIQASTPGPVKPAAPPH